MAFTLLTNVIDTGSRKRRRENNRAHVLEIKVLDFFLVSGKRTNTAWVKVIVNT
jgi:hypothetical protein